MDDIKNIIESLLFISEGPLSTDQIRSVLTDIPAADIRRSVNDLSIDYENRKGAIVLKEIAGGFQFRTRPEYKDYIHKLREPSPLKLSRAAMETLAIVAYQQPVLRSEVEHIRGVNSGNTLRFLQEKKLIRVLGRRDVPGRPLVYGTTKKFLETFDLKDLKDLPKPEEIGEEPPMPRKTQTCQTPDLPLAIPNSIDNYRFSPDAADDDETSSEETP